MVGEAAAVAMGVTKVAASRNAAFPEACAEGKDGGEVASSNQEEVEEAIRTLLMLEYQEEDLLDDE